MRTLILLVIFKATTLILFCRRHKGNTDVDFCFYIPIAISNIYDSISIRLQVNMTVPPLF